MAGLSDCRKSELFKKKQKSKKEKQKQKTKTKKELVCVNRPNLPALNPS
jgi:hypothetical protein